MEPLGLYWFHEKFQLHKMPRAHPPGAPGGLGPSGPPLGPRRGLVVPGKGRPPARRAAVFPGKGANGGHPAGRDGGGGGGGRRAACLPRPGPKRDLPRKPASRPLPARLGGKGRAPHGFPTRPPLQRPRPAPHWGAGSPVDGFPTCPSLRVHRGEGAGNPKRQLLTSLLGDTPKG